MERVCNWSKDVISERVRQQQQQQEEEEEDGRETCGEWLAESPPQAILYCGGVLRSCLVFPAIIVLWTPFGKAEDSLRWETLRRLEGWDMLCYIHIVQIQRRCRLFVCNWFVRICLSYGPHNAISFFILEVRYEKVTGAWNFPLSDLVLEISSWKIMIKISATTPRRGGLVYPDRSQQIACRDCITQDRRKMDNLLHR